MLKGRTMLTYFIITFIISCFGITGIFHIFFAGPFALLGIKQNISFIMGGIIEWILIILFYCFFNSEVLRNSHWLLLISFIGLLINNFFARAHQTNNSRQLLQAEQIATFILFVLTLIISFF